MSNIVEEGLLQAQLLRKQADLSQLHFFSYYIQAPKIAPAIKKSTSWYDIVTQNICQASFRGFPLHIAAPAAIGMIKPSQIQNALISPPCAPGAGCHPLT